MASLTPSYQLSTALGESIETPFSTGSSWKPPSMHCLLSFTFVTFLILWLLSPAASSVSWYRSCLVWSGLAYEIYSGGGPSTYVYCVVCYHVIVAPYERSVGHVFAYLYTLDDDSERPMDYETSLLPKGFPLNQTTTKRNNYLFVLVHSLLSMSNTYCLQLVVTCGILIVNEICIMRKVVISYIEL